MTSFASVCHHGWRTQAAWTKRKRERLNDDNNNGQLRIATPPPVAHAKYPNPTLARGLSSATACLSVFSVQIQCRLQLYNSYVRQLGNQTKPVTQSQKQGYIILINT